MQSGAPTSDSGARAGALHHGSARPPPRHPVPLGREPCASKIPDAQAAFESANTLLPTCLAGVNFVLHTAGWLEGGLAMGYEKFVMDADQAGMMHTLLAGFDSIPNGQALMPCARSAPASTFSAAPTRRPISRTPSIARRSRTTTATSNGKPRRDQHVEARQRAVEKMLADMCRRRWTPHRRSAARLHGTPQGLVPRLDV